MVGRERSVDIWWIVLVVFILAAVAVLFAMLRGFKQPPSLDDTSSARDFVAERETSRIGDMSVEDQAWQAASLAKDRANRERTPPTS
jgi:membrane protein implicated in regulation of membrane protease activity